MIILKYILLITGIYLLACMSMNIIGNILETLDAIRNKKDWKFNFLGHTILITLGILLIIISQQIN